MALIRVQVSRAKKYSGSRYLCSLPLLLIEVHKTLNKYQNVEMQYRPEGRFLFFVYKTVFRSLLHIVFTRKVIKVSGSHCTYSWAFHDEKHFLKCQNFKNSCLMKIFKKI